MESKQVIKKLLRAKKMISTRPLLLDWILQGASVLHKKFTMKL